MVPLVLAAAASPMCAQSSFPAEAVTYRTNTTLVERGGEWTPLTVKMTMPGGIQVFTNGTFRVNEGKVRRIKEEQMLRSDGYLLNPDGSIMPVFDHITLSGGAAMVFKDGEGSALAAPLTLADGSVINPDGSYARPSGRYSRLVNGQFLTLEGVPLGGLDTISFRDGKVVVHKSGATIPLQSANVIMGMYDGTRVRGDGFISYRDGTTAQMTEGQILTVPGVRASW